MGSFKRKAVVATDARPVKKVKAVDAAEEIAAKRSKNSTKPAKPARDNDNHDSEQRRPIPKSILQPEERAFPRGGASILTPIEQKQIKAQAEHDVLFEQQTGQELPRDDDGEELFEEHKVEEDTAHAKKKSRAKAKGDDSVKAAKLEGSAVHIQSLSYKTLTVGSTVLGRITTVTAQEIALAIPNNLTGFVPISSVSEILGGRIEKLVAAAKAGQAADSDEDNDDEHEDVDLKDMFHIGQWLRAVVTATSTERTDTSQSRRFIELTLDPRQVNRGLRSENVVINSMVQGSVRSIEDHGIVMDLGFSDTSTKGFISKKDLGTAYELEKIIEGQVMMCLVTGKGSNSQVVKLTPDAARFSVSVTADKKAPIVNEAPDIDSFLPGAAVTFLVTEVPPGGVAGKIMGMLDVTADLLHIPGSSKGLDLSKAYKIGLKISARITFAIPKDDGSRKLGVSLLKHLLVLPPAVSKLPTNASSKERSQAAELEQQRPNSSFVDDAAVTRAITERGLFLSLPSANGPTATAFAHISQVSDERIDSLSTTTGAYKLDSTHRVRVVSYNPLDNMYYVALKKSVLDQAFLRIEDVAVGTLVKGTVDRLVLGGIRGIVGTLVKLSDNVTGLIPDVHFSDVQLKNPELKFREGLPIFARVLSVDLEKKQLRLSLKKTLIEQDDAAERWTHYAGLEQGMESKGTIISLVPTGAVVQFYGNVRAYLPIAEMADTFVKSPEDHLRIGQTVNVRILSVDPDANQMKVSCKEDGKVDEAQQLSWDQSSAGQFVSGKVTEINNESITVDLKNGLKGSVRRGHLSDGAPSKADNTMKHIRMGQKLSELVILEKLERNKHLALSKKPSFVESAKAETLLCSLEHAKHGMKVCGSVRNITPGGIFLQFANGLVGMVHKGNIPPEMIEQRSFGLVKDQTVHAWIVTADEAQNRLTLSMREQKDAPPATAKQIVHTADLINPVDASISSTTDLTDGKITKARIVSIKGTQLNVRLADGVQGRVDVSEMFDTWEQIPNKKNPLHACKLEDVLDVKVLGKHDSRTHRFLPITHRQGVVSVFELSAKPSRIQNDSQDLLTMESVESGASYLAFVNNHKDDHIWVNLSPNVRGRISLIDLSEDVGSLQNLAKGFPIGSAIRVNVRHVDASTNRLNLSARTGDEKAMTLADISVGMILPARVTKSTERGLIVQLSESLAGQIPLFELSDDFALANPVQHVKNSIVRVSVLDIDKAHEKILLSLRHSKVLSSGLPVKDSQITSVSQLKPGDVVRGFVSRVVEKGIIVSLGAHVDAFVHMRNLSDGFLKDWRTTIEIDKLVKGRILTVDVDAVRIEMSLRESHTDPNYKAPITINELKEGMIVTGRVRKVENFGAFIDIDNTQPRLSGLCHKSEVAAKRVDDVTKLYSEGDLVKTKILKVDIEARKISLGLKASYFADQEEEEASDEDETLDAEGGVQIDGFDADPESDSDDTGMEGGVDIANVQDLDVEDPASEMDVDDSPPAQATSGLKTSGFNWAGDSFGDANGAVSDSEPEATSTKKRRHNKAEIKVDMTGDLDKYGPRSVSDFERQLLGQPNDSGLWIQYMAFQLQLSELQKARDIAERALRTIHIREGEEKANIWIAWLNLEVEHGDDESLEGVFKQACQLQDSLEMHGKLASIYIDSGKHSKADDIFARITANKSFRASPDVWLNYATFLIGTLNDPARARALLPRALQSVPINEHRLLTAKFAALEYHSANGDTERGRTIFEGLMSEWPKWSSGWDMWVDLERSRLTHFASEVSREDKTDAQNQVRQLYERMAKQKIKRRRAKFVFKRWLDFEEVEGDEKSADRVKALAKEFVEMLQARGEDDGEE